MTDRARSAEDRVKHSSQRTGRFVLEFGAAILVGTGVPLLWVWSGSRIQGSPGSKAVEAGTAVIIVAGILITYTVFLVVVSMPPGAERALRSAPAESPPVAAQHARRALPAGRRQAVARRGRVRRHRDRRLARDADLVLCVRGDPLPT